MITKDDIATYRANYNLDDFGVAGSLGFPTKGACAAINALCDAYEEIEKQRDELLEALENCRLLAARHRKEDWALLILGFCAEGGVVGSITR
mgnify:CR=1 FL=1